jgi:hypothetical protein
MDDILICDNCLVPLDITKIDSHVCEKNIISKEKSVSKVCFTKCQVGALLKTNTRCKVFSKQSKHTFFEKIINMGYDESMLTRLKYYFKNIVQVTINFKISNIDFYINDEYYRNGLEVSKLFSGDDKLRISREDMLFMNEYHHAKPFERVKYGAVNILNNKNLSNCLRSYGDCFFVIKNSVKPRMTFEYGDSYGNNGLQIGNFNNFYSVLCHLPNTLINELLNVQNNKPVNYSAYARYIETQIHGPVRFMHDIEEVVIPQKYYELYQNKINTFCKKYNIKLRYY